MINRILYLFIMATPCHYKKTPDFRINFKEENAEHHKIEWDQFLLSGDTGLHIEAKFRDKIEIILIFHRSVLCRIITAIVGIYIDPHSQFHFLICIGAFGMLRVHCDLSIFHSLLWSRFLGIWSLSIIYLHAPRWVITYQALTLNYHTNCDLITQPVLQTVKNSSWVPMKLFEDNYAIWS